MPHFIVDCSEEILVSHSVETILKYLHQVANNTKLFDESDIKVRINPFKTFLVGNKKQPFIHVFAHIMEGRTDEEKTNLSTLMVKRLSMMFPVVEHISMNVVDFNKAGYVNLVLLHAEAEQKKAAVITAGEKTETAKQGSAAVEAPQVEPASVGQGSNKSTA
jgi:5-carboxymethyl-2-hydroxymuconate isomerase